jgi:HK97 family phage major capsid protein
MTATAAPPATPTEFAEWLNTALATPEAAQAAVADGTLATTIGAYTAAQNKVMTDLHTQVDEQVQLAVHDLLERNGTEVGNRSSRLDLVARARQNHNDFGVLNSPAAAGAPLNGQFANAGEAIMTAMAAVGLRNTTGIDLEKMTNLRAYSEKVPSEGGVLVPEEYRSQIMTRALEQAIVRPRATVIPLTTGKMRWPAIDMTTEVGEVYGGMVFAWTDEGGTITPSDATFAAIALEANKLTGGALVPNELLRDAAALTAWLMTNLPNGLGHFEDLGFLAGNGVKKPLGQLHPDNPALITASKEVGQPAATITWLNVLSMFSRLLPECFANSVWVISPDCIPEVFTMAVPVGTGGSAVMIGDGSGTTAAQGLPQTLLGRPIIWSRKTPGLLGTKGDITLTDFSTYVIGDTMDMRIDTSEHASFWTDKTGFRIIERVDGQPTHLSALTPSNGGPTLSCCVQLETR